MQSGDHTFAEAAASYIRAGGEAKYLERAIACPIISRSPKDVPNWG